MERIIGIKINCGEKTCAFEKGRFCFYFHSTIFGDADCMLFGKNLEVKEGWTQRCSQCLELEQKDVSPPN